MLHAVIMAGGSGTRFWPQSRKQRPKQLLPLAGSESLIQQTAARCQPWIPPERIWVVTNARQIEATREQLPQVPPGNFLVEPCGRNTAPCVGMAAIRLLQADPEAEMLVLPADHVIQPDEVFQAACQRAASVLVQHPEGLILFGVRPTYPATGFGYIERGQPLADRADAIFEVARFREKPDAPTAADYLASGRFYWNCGIFVWRAARILQALAEYEPELSAGLRQLTDAADWSAAVDQVFPTLKSISIDYAVLERAQHVFVLEAPFGWDDVGSWLAVARLRGADDAGNTIDGPWSGVSTKDCIVRTTPDHLVATIGVEDLVIVHTSDATLVARKSDEDGLRKLVSQLEQEGRGNLL